MTSIERIHFFEEKPQWLGKNTNHSKRLILSLTIATIFTLGVVAFSSTSMAVAEDRISSTGGEIQVAAEVGIQLAAEVGIQLAAVNCGADPQPIVAMVTTNGFNSGTATILVGDLTASGFTVRDLDVSGGIPECVTKLYISSEAFANCLLTPFTAAQEATIVNWIATGGEAWINGEWGLVNRPEGDIACGDGTVSLIENFVTAANIDQDSNGPFVDGVDFDSTIPATATLFAGVNSYQQSAGSHFVDAAGDPAVVVDQGQHPNMIAGPFQDGCVVIMGDSNWPHDAFINVLDNRQLANNAIAFINECATPIEVVKTWTFTDYNWDPICTLIDAATGECLATRPANIDIPEDDVLADPLPQDANDKYTAFAQVHMNGLFSNTNPGAFYALTAIDVLSDVDGLTVWEDYDDCTDQDVDGDDMDLKLVFKTGTRNVKVAIADPDGDVTEITDEIYDGVGGEITSIDNDSAHVDILRDIPAGSTVYVLVKFQDDLKGVDTEDGIFDAMCDNSEWVHVLDEVDPDTFESVFEAHADAALRISNAP